MMVYLTPIYHMGVKRIHFFSIHFSLPLVEKFKQPQQRGNCGGVTTVNRAVRTCLILI